MYEIYKQNDETARGVRKEIRRKNINKKMRKSFLCFIIIIAIVLIFRRRRSSPHTRAAFAVGGI